MSLYLVDSNVILDVVLDDPRWAPWSLEALTKAADDGTVCINPVIYSEVSVGYNRIEELEAMIDLGGFRFLEIPREALFLAGKAFLSYRRHKGTRRSPLPDFYIGAHAAVCGMKLVTRDVSRYATYFPTVELVSP